MRALVSALAIILTVAIAPAAPAAAPTDDWHGSRHAMPSAYGWLNDYTPDVDYEVMLVRGLSPAQVRRTIGTVQRQLRAMSPNRSEWWVMNHTDHQDYSAPDVALIERRGPAVLVYLPYWFVGDETIARLSREGLAEYFTTDVEWDTYVTVARRGKVVRSFDAGFRPPRKGALPEERGLDWGARHQNIWATAWAFLERVSRIHIDRAWFRSPHPAYVFEGRGP